jgi:type IV secretory pathway VirB3-like protein
MVIINPLVFIVMGLIKYLFVGTAVVYAYTVYLQAHDPKQYQIHQRNMNKFGEAIRKYWSGK